LGFVSIQFLGSGLRGSKPTYERCCEISSLALGEDSRRGQGLLERDECLVQSKHNEEHQSGHKRSNDLGIACWQIRRVDNAHQRESRCSSK
jgi:hypothetical protein